MHDKDLLVPAAYAAHGYPHETWEQLRREDPVHRVEDWDGPPYWAITKHADVVHLSKNPDRFVNQPRMIMEPGGADPGQIVRTLIVMDPPEHRQMRGLVSNRFTPRALKRIVDEVDGITNRILDAAATHGEIRETDFVESIAAPIPIWVIAEMLGVPTDRWRDLYDWTNAAVGAGDPEFNQGRPPEEVRVEAIMRMAGFFKELSDQRRGDPRDDLVSLLVHAEVDGEPLNDFDLLSYYNLILAAGNETTRNAISGALHLLLQHPEQFERLRAKPELLDSFVEEALRFLSPVIHFCRTSKEDFELGGKKIRAGEPMVLFYPSANRDEAVFDRPNEFDITRNPNPHLAFGIGEHFCIGTHVARLEMRTLFRHLLRRLEHVELVSPPERLAFATVGGIKHMQIRYRLD
ncbi:MAG: cytochrome P450 [Myxococcota bacterium]